MSKSKELGKLEHTLAKPRYGRKSVRFRSPDLPPGRIFHETDTRNPMFGVPGPETPKEPPNRQNPPKKIGWANCLSVPTTVTDPFQETALRNQPPVFPGKVKDPIKNP